MIEQHLTITTAPHVTDPVEIVDRLLPGGRLVLQPGVPCQVHIEAYRSFAARYQHRIVRVMPTLPETPAPEPLDCPKCGKTCKSAIGLRSHVKNCKANDNAPEVPGGEPANMDDCDEPEEADSKAESEKEPEETNET